MAKTKNQERTSPSVCLTLRRDTLARLNELSSTVSLNKSHCIDLMTAIFYNNRNGLKRMAGIYE